MKLNDIRVGRQLTISFGIILALIILLAGISWDQSNSISLQTQEIYEHPLTVQRALGTLMTDIQAMHKGMKDLFLAEDENELETVLLQLEINNAEAETQFSIIKENFLGEPKLITQAHDNFVQWNAIRAETIRIFRQGKVEEAADRTKPSGIGGAQAKKLINSIAEIREVAVNFADHFYQTSEKHNRNLKLQLLFITLFILLVTLLMVLWLTKSVKQPLFELKRAANAFTGGQRQARSRFSSANEFGELSSSFNNMAAHIEEELMLRERVEKFSEVMLQEEEADRFCQNVLNHLLHETDAQLGAVYLLNEQTSTFEPFVSVGMEVEGCRPFSATNLEGEFGKALAEKKWQHITRIPDDSRFVFSGVSGSFQPREIITIPIVAAQQTIAVISLASIREFEQKDLKLIGHIYVILSARVRSVFMHRKLILLSEKLQENYNLLEIQKNEIKTSSDMLQEQNTELEEQKRELSAQSRELTEQNTELEVQKNQLVEANKLKTSFLSNMSHELRTPLNSIISLSSLMERQLTGTISEEQNRFLEIINRNGKNLLELINDILDLSRIEAGQEYLELESFDLNQLLGEVVELLNPLADQKGIDFVQVNPDQSVWMTSDIKKCKHIFYNIVGNAIKFTEAGKVEVLVKATNNEVAVQVTDTGIGIHPSHVENIFDEFRQADSSTSRRYGGTGLGLAIARKYAHMLKGSIQVDTQPGKGSVFTVLLPPAYIQKPETSTANVRNRLVSDRPDEPAARATEVVKDGKSILLIEDSEAAVIQVKDALENHGFEVIVASGGQSALKILETTIPDGVILDLMMPEIDGFSVLRKIRETENMALVPVLILTAKHVTKDELNFLKGNNIFQLIQKGDVDLPNLLDAVSRMVTPHEIKEDPMYIKSSVRHSPPMVLIAEDNKDNMLTIKALLGNGYQFIEAENGEQAVKLAIEYTPDLILMDIALPGMSGMEAFSQIRNRENLAHIPVIAVTANAMAGDRETILNHGFHAYLAKPIDENVFIRLVNDLFGS